MRRRACKHKSLYTCIQNQAEELRELRVLLETENEESRLRCVMLDQRTLCLYVYVHVACLHVRVKAMSIQGLELFHVRVTD